MACIIIVGGSIRSANCDISGVEDCRCYHMASISSPSMGNLET